MITLNNRTKFKISFAVFFSILLASNGYCKDIPNLSECDKFFKDLSNKKKFVLPSFDHAKWLLGKFRGVSHIFVGEFIEKIGPEPRLTDMDGGSSVSQLVKYRVLETLFVAKPKDPKNLKLKVGSEIITREPMRNMVVIKGNDGNAIGIKLPEKIFHPKARFIVMMRSKKNSKKSIRLPNDGVAESPDFSNHTVSLIGKGTEDNSENRSKVEFLLSCRKNFWSKRWGHP